MRMLFLSQRFLLPMDTGGKIRTGKILEQLTKTNDVTLISNVESPKDDSYVAEMPRFSHDFLAVPWKEVPKYSWKFFVRLLVQIFSRYPVSVLNSSSDNLRFILEQEASQRHVYDVIICDFVQSALEFRNIQRIPTVLFQHNVESVIAKRHMLQTNNPVAKLFWWLQWQKMFRFEQKACQSFDTVIAVSEKDKETFESLYHLKNVETIPTGVDIDFFRPNPTVSVDNRDIVFCGSMDWLPNDNAAMYFINDILPRIKKNIPDCHFTVVGRNPSPLLQKLAEQRSDVAITGWVEDIRPYLWRGAVVIVPIRIGGGTRMKIYEAMAMGKSVVSTSIGAEGLQFNDGKHLFIADTPDTFAETIIRLLQDPQKRDRIGEAASNFVRDHFSWERVAKIFEHICKMTREKK